MNTLQHNKDKTYFRWVLILSVAVFALVVILNQRWLPKPAQTPDWIFTLPLINALLNGTCFFMLLLSLYFIKQKNIDAHKKINLFTFFLSALFLVSYVTFHYFVNSTEFPKDSPLRGIYLAILIPHIILAAVVLPLILVSFYYGLNMQVDKHRKIVRFTYPIWLFVTLSGVLVYLLISPYYQF